MRREEREAHARWVALAQERGLPDPPRLPRPTECCERHCDPCIWDYYARALLRWRERHDLPADAG